MSFAAYVEIKEFSIPAFGIRVCTSSVSKHSEQGKLVVYIF